MATRRPRRSRLPRPARPPDKLQNLPTLQPLGKSVWVRAHWRWNYERREWEWVRGHWRK